MVAAAEQSLKELYVDELLRLASSRGGKSAREEELERSKPLKSEDVIPPDSPVIINSGPILGCQSRPLRSTEDPEKNLVKLAQVSNMRSPRLRLFEAQIEIRRVSAQKRRERERAGQQLTTAEEFQRFRQVELPLAENVLAESGDQNLLNGGQPMNSNLVKQITANEPKRTAARQNSTYRVKQQELSTGFNYRHSLKHQSHF